MKKVIVLILLIELLLIGILFLTPDLVSAQGETVQLTNPLEFVGVTEPGELVVKGFIGFASIIAVVAVAFMVFSGFKLVVATTEESRTGAKQSLIWSVGGFVVALLAFTVVSGVAQLIGFEPSLVDLSGDTLESPLVVGSGDPRNFIDVMNFIMRNVLGLLGFATTLLIIYYGFRYLTSAGNEEAIEQAKTGLKWAVIGLVVTLLVFTIITIVRQWILSIGT